MQLDLNNLSDWSKAFNLSFNQNKFVHLHFRSDTTSPDTDTGVQGTISDRTLSITRITYTVLEYTDINIPIGAHPISSITK